MLCWPKLYFIGSLPGVPGGILGQFSVSGIREDHLNFCSPQSAHKRLTAIVQLTIP